MNLKKKKYKIRIERNMQTIYRIDHECQHDGNISEDRIEL